MDAKEAVAYRDLTDAEIIAMAETRVALLELGDGYWSWLDIGRTYNFAGETLPRFHSKLDAADDAVCELGLDD